jgi:hypothetical protein
LLILLAVIFGALFAFAALAAILLALFAVQATDSVERDTMYSFALVFALPTALISLGLYLWLRRALRRPTGTLPSAMPGAN